MYFSKKLKTLRLNKNLFQKTFATWLGIPFSTYKGWENGALPRKIEHLAKLKNKLNLSTDELLFEGDFSSMPEKKGELLLRYAHEEIILANILGRVELKKDSL